mgnify:CR=1 FL=1
MPPMRIKALWCTFLCALTITASAAADGPPSPALTAATSPSVVFGGLRVLSEDAVRNAMGNRPATVRDADRAVRRIVSFYRSRGYTEARAWFRFDPDRTLRIEVDEGRMAAVVFPDSSAREVLDFRAELTLIEDVFHRPTVEAAVARLRSRLRAW